MTDGGRTMITTDFITPNFITPIQVPQSLGSLTSTQKTEMGEGGSLFKDIFGNMISDVKEAEENLTQQQYLLATGQIDDVHTLGVAASEAQLAIDMLVQMRNKAVEAYNELMRITL